MQTIFLGKNRENSVPCVLVAVAITKQIEINYNVRLQLLVRSTTHNTLIRVYP